MALSASGVGIVELKFLIFVSEASSIEVGDKSGLTRWDLGCGVLVFELRIQVVGGGAVWGQ